MITQRNKDIYALYNEQTPEPSHAYHFNSVTKLKDLTEQKLSIAILEP